MSRDLHRHSTTPEAAVRSAKFLFESKKQETVFVEGLKDCRFYNQYKTSDLRIQELGSKDKVLDAFNFCSKTKEYENQTYMHFVVDLDKDVLLNKQLINAQQFNYHVWHKSRQHGFNDLESYLVSSNPFDKILANFDEDLNNIPSLRNNLYISASFIGAFRLADELIQQQKGLAKTILDGLIILDDWIDNSMCLDQQAVVNAITLRLKNNPNQQLLVQEAQKIFTQRLSDILLCRGHDLSKIMTVGIEKRHRVRLNEESIELNLRLAAEKAILDKSIFATFSFWNLL